MSVENPDNENSGMTEYERRLLALEEAKLSGGCSTMGWPVGCLTILLATILAVLVVGPFGLIAIPFGLIAVWIMRGNNPVKKARKDALRKTWERKGWK